MISLKDLTTAFFTNSLISPPNVCLTVKIYTGTIKQLLEQDLGEGLGSKTRGCDKLWDIWKWTVPRMFGRGINKLHQPSKKLDFSSMVMRDGLVLPCVPFRPAHRIACILHSAQDKENGLFDGMIKPYRWPNLCRARETSSWTSSKYSNCLHPPDKFMVLEKKSTIQKKFWKKKFKIQKEIKNSWE